MQLKCDTFLYDRIVPSCNTHLFVCMEQTLAWFIITILTPINYYS